MRRIILPITLFICFVLMPHAAQGQNPAVTDSTVDALYQEAKAAMDDYVGNNGLVEIAIPRGQELVAIAPDSPYGYYILSRCARHLSYYSGDKYNHEKVRSEALPYAEKAVELAPKMSLMQMNLAMCYYCLAEYPRALESMNKAVDLSENAEARAFNLIHKGLILKSSGDLQNALATFKQAEKGPMSQSTQIILLDQMGGTYGKMGRYDDEIDCRERRLAVQPDNHWGKHNLAGAYREKGKELVKENFDLQEAERVLFKSLSLEENDSTYRWLAQCYYKMGDYDKSLEYVNILLRRDPTNEWALEKKNKLQSKEGY